MKTTLSKISILLVFLSEIICYQQSFAQNIGINGSGATAHPSALLDIDAASTPSLGVLIPRIALTAINVAAPVTSPATSLLVYNTATASSGITAVSPGYYYWDAVKWVRFAYNASGSSSTAWDLLGNAGTNPSTNFIGTTDNQALAFRTNNVEKMRMLANGNLGLNTTTPIASLEIATNTLQLAAPGLKISSSYNGNYVASSIVLQSDADWSHSSGIFYLNTAAVNAQKKEWYAGVPYAAYGFGIGLRKNVTTHGQNDNMTADLAYNKFFIDTTGNVGIGTTSPGSPLTVVGNVNSLIPSGQGQGFFEGNSNNIGISLNNTQLGGRRFDIASSGGSASPVSSFRIFDFTANLDRIVINSIGNVGIGTSTPGAKTHIVHTSTVTSDAILMMTRGATTTEGWFRFHSGATAGEWSGLASNGDKSMVFTNDNDASIDDNTGLVIAPWANSANPTGSKKGIKIMENGKVGIGTTAPTYRLHVYDQTGGANTVSALFETNSTASGITFKNTTSVFSPAIFSQANDISLWTGGNSQLWITQAGNVGIGTGFGAPAFKLDVVGTANCSSNTWTSDRRKKQNIQPLILTGLDVINKLKPVTFEWIKVEDDGMKGTQMGFIAQELEQVLPSMVVTANNDEQSKAVKYNELLPVLVKAIQEMDTKYKGEIAELKKQNEKIMQLLKNK